jgi:hypothetical protein
VIDAFREAGARRGEHVADSEGAAAGARVRAAFDAAFWRRDPVDECDVGALVFGVIYDPATRRFGRVEFEVARDGPVARPSREPLVPPAA